MKRFITAVLLTGSLSACLFNNDPDFDYPPSDRSLLKGPRIETLTNQTVSVQQTTQLPFQGSVRQFGSRYFIESYITKSGELTRWSVLDNGQVSELPYRRFNTTFLDQQGNAWGLAIKTDGIDTLYRFETNQWKQYALLSTEKWYAPLMEVLDNQFVFDTNEGVVVWDVPTKQRKELISKNKARHFTASYMIGYENRSVLIHDRNTRQLLHSIQAGYELWDAYEDSQQRLWFVVRDKNWDGLLYRYTNKTSQLLTTVPVGNYDSARGVGPSFIDRKGNYWIQIEGVSTVFTPAGTWLKPVLPAQPNQLDVSRAFLDKQNNVVVSDSKQLFTVSLP